MFLLHDNAMLNFDKREKFRYFTIPFSLCCLQHYDDLFHPHKPWQLQRSLA